MLADPLTKPVTEAKLTKMRTAWGLYSTSYVPLW